MQTRLESTQSYTAEGVSESLITRPESDTSIDRGPLERRLSNWVKIGLVAAGSALAGGFAAAWWYRNTLKTLRQTGETTSNPNFGIARDIEPDED